MEKAKAVFQKREHSEADEELMHLQLLFPITFSRLFNSRSFQDSYGLKEAGAKWLFVKLLKRFEKNHTRLSFTS